MAQLTKEEQAAFKKRGLWVRERCDRDGCPNAIGYISYKSRDSKRVYCTEQCRDASEQQPTKFRKSRLIVTAPIEPEETAEPVELDELILSTIHERPKLPWNSGSLFKVLHSHVDGGWRALKDCVKSLVSSGKLKEHDGLLRATTTRTVDKTATQSTSRSGKAGKSPGISGNRNGSEHSGLRFRDTPVSE